MRCSTCFAAEATSGGSVSSGSTGGGEIVITGNTGGSVLAST
jgi:hypothetical protein